MINNWIVCDMIIYQDISINHHIYIHKHQHNTSNNIHNFTDFLQLNCYNWLTNSDISPLVFLMDCAAILVNLLGLTQRVGEFGLFGLFGRLCPF